MRVAVITPYFKPRLDWLRQCHESVLAQTHPCTHILVADGEPLRELDDWQIQHVLCSQNHADYGDTPRCIGAMSAVGQGFDAVTYLDADNWYSPEHIETLVRLHRETGAPICLSNRNLYRPDGSLLGLCPETDGNDFADTNCMFLTRPAFQFISLWALMDTKLHAIGDRVVMHRIRNSRMKRAFNPKPTVAYRTMFPGHYERFGEKPPPGVKASTAPMKAAFEYLVAKGGPDLRSKFRRKQNPFRHPREAAHLTERDGSEPRPKARKKDGAGASAVSRNKIVMFHNGRCGSTVLGSMLNQHPQVQWDSEIFDAPGALVPKLRPWHRWNRSSHYPNEPFRYLRSRMRKGGKQWYGFEMKFHHVNEIKQSIATFVDTVERMGFTHFILLNRANYLRVVISTLVAAQKSKFHMRVGHDPEFSSVQINVDEVYPQGGSLLALFRWFDSTFPSLQPYLKGKPVLSLGYENHILDTPLEAYRLVCDFMDLEPAAPTVDLVRTTPWPLQQVVENFNQVVAVLRGTPYEWMTSESSR